MVKEVPPLVSVYKSECPKGSISLVAAASALSPPFPPTADIQHPGDENRVLAIPGLNHRTGTTTASIHHADIRARFAPSAPQISNRGPSGRCVPGRLVEKQVSRNQRASPMTQARHVQIGDLTLGNDRPLVLIAGPCVLESRALAEMAAGRG